MGGFHCPISWKQLLHDARECCLAGNLLGPADVNGHADERSVGSMPGPCLTSELFGLGSFPFVTAGCRGLPVLYASIW